MKSVPKRETPSRIIIFRSFTNDISTFFYSLSPSISFSLFLHITWKRAYHKCTAWLNSLNVCFTVNSVLCAQSMVADRIRTPIHWWAEEQNKNLDRRIFDFDFRNAESPPRYLCCNHLAWGNGFSFNLMCFDKKRDILCLP